MDLSGKKKKDDVAVQAVEAEWREKLRGLSRFRAYAEVPFTEEDYASIREVIARFGVQYTVVMVGALIAQWKQYRELLIGPEDDGSFPPIGYVCGLADTFALALYARGDILVEPRWIAIDWTRLDPVEVEWRTWVFTALGEPSALCLWELSKRQKAAAKKLIKRFGAERAATFVEHVLLHWDRYRYLTPDSCDAPTLHEISNRADAWINLAEHYTEAPPFPQDSDAPFLPVRACGRVEALWREAAAWEFPACATEAENEPWTERDKELVDALRAQWGDGTVLNAVRSFFPMWRRAEALRSPLPSRDDFVKYCRWWCRSQSAPKGAAEGAYRNDSSAREHDDEWRTAAALAKQWGVPEQEIREAAEQLGLHDDPRMARPVRIA